jgi:hypothetical protein
VSADLTYSKSQEGENSSAYQRRGQPSWISIHFKKIQSFFGTPRRTAVVNLVSDIYTMDRWTSDIFSSEKLSRASRSGEIIIFAEDPTMNIPTKFVPIAPVVSEKKAKI